MTFDLYGTYGTTASQSPKNKAARLSVEQRIAAAEWRREGDTLVLRVLDECEYLKHGDKTGDEFFRCELTFYDDWVACCYHEDREDPDDSFGLDIVDVTDEEAAKTEAEMALRSHIRHWEEVWEYNNLMGAEE